jgi:hypothetical protein
LTIVEFRMIEFLKNTPNIKESQMLSEKGGRPLKIAKI